MRWLSMSVKTELLKKVPADTQQQPHFLALLDYIKTNRLVTNEQLRKSITTEIGVVEAGLVKARSAGPSAVKMVRDKTIQLELLQKWNWMSKEYLL